MEGCLRAAFLLLNILALRVTSFPGGLGMKDRDLEKMELDDLWDLHQRIIEVLDRKLENEKRKSSTAATTDARIPL